MHTLIYSCDHILIWRVHSPGKWKWSLQIKNPSRALDSIVYAPLAYERKKYVYLQRLKSLIDRRVRFVPSGIEKLLSFGLSLLYAHKCCTCASNNNATWCFAHAQQRPQIRHVWLNMLCKIWKWVCLCSRTTVLKFYSLNIKGWRLVNFWLRWFPSNPWIHLKRDVIPRVLDVHNRGKKQTVPNGTENGAESNECLLVTRMLPDVPPWPIDCTLTWPIRKAKTKEVNHVHRAQN